MSFLWPSFSFGQTSLTQANNGFRDGDSLVMKRVGVVYPGPAGGACVWDFSDAETGRKHISQHIQ